MKNTIKTKIEFGPLKGECFICGKFLDSYWNKFINLDDGRISCEEHDTIDRKPSLSGQGFFSYSDG